MQRKINSADISERFHIVNRNTGDDMTGLTSVSAGASAWYIRDNSAPVQITLSDLTTITDAHSDGGLFEYTSGGFTPGLYRLDVPDAAYASGASEVSIYLGFTDSITSFVTVQLVDYTSHQIDIYSVAGTPVAGVADFQASLTATDGNIATLQSDVTAIKAITDTLGLTEIADAVWDEVLTGHVTPDSAGAQFGSLTQTERDALADNLLKRDFTGITGESAHCLLQAIRSLRFYDVTGGVLTVYKEDGTTSAWTATLTQGTAQPVTAVSPPV